MGFAPSGGHVFGGLPLVQTHSEVTNFGILCQEIGLFAFEEGIEPAVGEGVIIEPGIAHAAFADYGVFAGALVRAVEGGSDDGILFVGDFGRAVLRT